MTIVDLTKDPDAGTMTVVAEYPATPDRVWQLWADPRQLERWWGPPSHPATVTDHDLVAGGEVRYFMSGLDVPASRIADPVRWLIEGSVRGREGYRLPTAVRPLEPVMSSLAPHQIPPHYRRLRRTMLAVVCVITFSYATGLLAAIAITGWRLAT